MDTKTYFFQIGNLQTVIAHFSMCLLSLEFTLKQIYTSNVYLCLPTPIASPNMIYIYLYFVVLFDRKLWSMFDYLGVIFPRSIRKRITVCHVAGVVPVLTPNTEATLPWPGTVPTMEPRLKQEKNHILLKLGKTQHTHKHKIYKKLLLETNRKRTIHKCD